MIAEGERHARLRLARTDQVGPVAFRQLLQRFGSAEAALDASVQPGAVLLALDGVFAQAGRPWAVLSVERA